MARQGHDVAGVDIDPARIAAIVSGIAPFHEPGLTEVLREVEQAKRLTASVSADEALIGADLAMVCVGTPGGPNGAHDMAPVTEVSRQIAHALRGRAAGKITLAYRSTLRPGSIRALVAPIFAAVLGPDWRERIELVYNPEFLREAKAIADYFSPPKIVIGTWDGAPCAIMTRLYSGLEAPSFICTFEEAELTKFIDNSWHATKVAFANEIGRLCQRMNIDVGRVHEIFIADTKLNISPYYLRPGGAFGGSCLPKDLRALSRIASDFGIDVPLLDSLLRSNDAHKTHHFEAVRQYLPNGGRVLLAGLAFKAETDDLRESPNVDLARKLLAAGYELRVFDPQLATARRRGQNRDPAYAHASLPSIERLLIQRDEADAGDWDLVIVNNATGKALNLAGKPVLILHAI